MVLWFSVDFRILYLKHWICDINLKYKQQISRSILVSAGQGKAWVQRPVLETFWSWKMVYYLCWADHRRHWNTSLTTQQISYSSNDFCFISYGKLNTLPTVNLIESNSNEVVSSTGLSNKCKLPNHLLSVCSPFYFKGSQCQLFSFPFQLKIKQAKSIASKPWGPSSPCCCFFWLRKDCVAQTAEYPGAGAGVNATHTWQVFSCILEHRNLQAVGAMPIQHREISVSYIP